jgi:hypothetical protein
MYFLDVRPEHEHNNQAPTANPGENLTELPVPVIDELESIRPRNTELDILEETEESDSDNEAVVPQPPQEGAEISSTGAGDTVPGDTVLGN